MIDVLRRTVVNLQLNDAAGVNRNGIAHENAK